MQSVWLFMAVVVGPFFVFYLVGLLITKTCARHSFIIDTMNKLYLARIDLPFQGNDINDFIYGNNTGCCNSNCS